MLTPLMTGFSGAPVYRVEATNGDAFVLKLGKAEKSFAGWRVRMRLQETAAQYGLAPRVVHVDETRRAVLADFVDDRSFPAYYSDAHTHPSAVRLLGETLKRVHSLPLPESLEEHDPHTQLKELWSGLAPNFVMPGFVGDAVGNVLAEPPVRSDRPRVLSHNDVNPGNIMYDGERLLLLDWEHAGPNDPYFDLAAIAVFVCMDDATCGRLLSAYDGSAVETLPASFNHFRRVVAAWCGMVFLKMAREGGHHGATDETLESTPSLGEFYQRMLSGRADLASPDSRWEFGLSLVKTTFEICPRRSAKARRTVSSSRHSS
jgi:aminoglycoside phosphotransferase